MLHKYLKLQDYKAVLFLLVRVSKNLGVVSLFCSIRAGILIVIRAGILIVIRAGILIVIRAGILIVIRAGILIVIRAGILTRLGEGSFCRNFASLLLLYCFSIASLSTVD
jgi:hypothetical protein